MRNTLYSVLMIWPAILFAESAKPASPVILLDHGAVCDVAITGQQDAPLTESGQLNLIDQDRTIDVTTQAIPARRGLSFGIRVTMKEGAALADTRIVVQHPPLGAARVTTQSWPVLLHAKDASLNLYTFEYDYEMVQGRWTFQVLSAQGVALTQDFEVVGPFAVQDVQDACFPAQITS